MQVSRGLRPRLLRARPIRRGAATLLAGSVGFAGFAVPASTAAGAARPAARCNGHAQLCRRRFDEVAFPATHNSMSTVADDFASPEQERSIADQLDGGIRALLVDVHTGTPTAERVCTDPTPLDVARIRRERGQAGLDQLLAVRDAQCPPAGGPDAALFLCHGFCELGATRFSDALRTVKTFLARHRGDVVTLILEDYSPVADIRKAFRSAGLERALVHHRPGRPWPTLGAMQRRGTRLVVFLQNQGGTEPGLLDAFAEMGETPYTFHSPAELSCAPNRGPAQSPPLFLLNHWIDTPDRRAAADEVNAHDVLAGRATQCQRERGHIPNFVAVNFAEDGDLLPVVDELNGVANAQ